MSMSSASEAPDSKENDVQSHGEKKICSTKAFQEREKAIRFLNSPSIAHLPKEMKENYLKQKGFDSQDIETLYHEMNNKKFDIIWNSENDSKSIVKEGPTQQYPRQHRYYPQQPLYPSYDQSNDKEISLPNPIVPMTIGGMIAVFGVATFRWLNGQDFVLFPTTSDGNITSTNNEVDDIHSEAYNATNSCDNDREEEEPFTRDIQNLTTTIENLAQIQKDTIKILERDKATKVTNVAMTALRKHSNTNNSNHDLLDKIVECKCAFDALMKECKSWNMQSQPEGSESTSHDLVSSTLSKLESIGSMLESIQSMMTDKIHTPTFDAEKENPDHSQEKEHDAQNTSNTSTVETNDSPELSPEKIGSILDKGKESISNSVETGTSIVQSDVSTTIPSMESFQEAFQKLQSSNSPTLIKSGCQMLYLHISNLIAHPSDTQFKRISTKSNTFKNKIGKVQFATHVLKSVGFIEEGSYLVYKNQSERIKLQEQNTSNQDDFHNSGQYKSILESNELELLQGAISALKQVL